MIPRVPRLFAEPNARQIAEYKLTGHAVSVERPSARSRFPTGRRAGQRRCVADLVCQMPTQFDWMLGATVGVKKGALDCAEHVRETQRQLGRHVVRSVEGWFHEGRTRVPRYLLQYRRKPQRIVPWRRLLRGGRTETIAQLWACLGETVWGETDQAH